jgi:hypothetical protein
MIGPESVSGAGFQNENVTNEPVNSLKIKNHDF